MARQLSESAQAAAALRKEIKQAFPHVKFTCKSDNYSMGSSVNVSYQDVDWDTHKEIVIMASKYQYGHFDGMEDIYEYSNVNDDIPQAKFVFCNNSMSEDKKEEVYNEVKAYWNGGDELPEKYADARNQMFQGMWMDQLVWRHFTGAYAS